MHGGLSPELKSLEQIKRVARPTDVPDSGLLCDLLWADPDKDIQGWGENDRGVSYTFGPDCVTEFLQKHDLDLICRAHQVKWGTGLDVNGAKDGSGTLVCTTSQQSKLPRTGRRGGQQVAVKHFIELDSMSAKRQHAASGCSVVSSCPGLFLMRGGCCAAGG